MREEVTVFGRRFVLTIDGPDSDRRFSATIADPATGRILTRNPVRGRSADDARDRALEVTHNLVGIERLQEAILAAAREAAPGAVVDLTEDARGIRAELSGGWELDALLIVPRDEVYDPAFDPDAARERIRVHIASHARRTTP